MTDKHDAAVEAACRAAVFIPASFDNLSDKTKRDRRNSARRAIAAFLREWRPSDEACEGAGRPAHKLQYAARATADELDPPSLRSGAARPLVTP